MAYNELFDIEKGDNVIVKYKNSVDFMKTGLVISVVMKGTTTGDCTVLFDFEKKTAVYYWTNLLKIIRVFEQPSGESFNLAIDDLVELTMVGIVRLDAKTNSYFFNEKDRWEIDRYCL